MQLIHIDFKDLRISKANMRYRDPAPDVSDILPSVREKGVLVPLIVRSEDGKFGVVAGRRRWFSLKVSKDESGEVSPPPCAVMEDGDDAAAIEASLLENIARRDPDPMREYETFTRLIKEGRTMDGIAATFGMTATQVRQRLALGNLLPKIRDAYRAGEIDDETVRHLTMASSAQQKKWLRIFEDPEQYAPQGLQLKRWLLGGSQIATAHALFDFALYTGPVVEDLFGEERYFADTDQFWSLQNRAIADKRDGLLMAGWNAVDILEIGQRFEQYAYVRTSKKKDGKVFIEIRHDGAVQIFDGWLSQKDARKNAKAENAGTKDGKKDPVKPTGPIVTHALQNYIDLHRHLAVRQTLLARPDVAFRLAVAHMIAPSGNWNVQADRQTARTPAIRSSIANSPAQAMFDVEKQAVFALLEWTDRGGEASFVTRCGTADVFAQLLTLSEAEVFRIATFFMACSLQSGSDTVEAVGTHLNTDTRGYWQADDVFFDLVRDRATVNALLSDIAGEDVAKANVAEKAKTQKQIMRDCFSGSNNRPKVEGWLPGWLEFPQVCVGQGALPKTIAADVEPERMAAE